MKKLIDHYKEWDKEGQLPDYGLCDSIPSEYEKSLLLFKPTDAELDELESLRMAVFFWASGLSVFDVNKCRALTPLRETIILLICAMHDEI
jgi:hypothetical protein